MKIPPCRRAVKGNAFAGTQRGCAWRMRLQGLEGLDSYPNLAGGKRRAVFQRVKRIFMTFGPWREERSSSRERRGEPCGPAGCSLRRVVIRAKALHRMVYRASFFTYLHLDPGFHRDDELRHGLPRGRETLRLDGTMLWRKPAVKNWPGRPSASSGITSPGSSSGPGR